MANTGFIKKQRATSPSLSEVYPIRFSDDSHGFRGRLRNWFLLKKHFGEIRIRGRCLLPSAYERHRRKQKDRATFLMLQGTLTDEQLVWLGWRLRVSPQVRAANVCWRVSFPPHVGYHYLRILESAWPPAVDLHFFMDDRLYWWKEQHSPLPSDKPANEILRQWEGDFHTFFAAATGIRMRHALWMQTKEVELFLRSDKNRETFAENEETLQSARLYRTTRRLDAAEQQAFQQHLTFLERKWVQQELRWRQLEKKAIAGIPVILLRLSVRSRITPKKFQESIYGGYRPLGRPVFSMERHLCFTMMGISLEEWDACVFYSDKQAACVNGAYKKRALLLHPDKKTGNIAQFTLLGQVKHHLLRKFNDLEEATFLPELLAATEASYHAQGGDNIELPAPHLEAGKNLCINISQQVEQMRAHEARQKKKVKLAAWSKWVQYHYPDGDERSLLLNAYAQERKALLKEEALATDRHLGRWYVFKKEWLLLDPLLKHTIPPIKALKSLDQRLDIAKAQLAAYGKQAVHWYHPLFLGGKTIDAYVRSKGYEAVISAADTAKPTFPWLDRWLGKATRRNALAVYARLSAPLSSIGTKKGPAKEKSQAFFKFMEALLPTRRGLLPSHVLSLPASHALFKRARALETLFPRPDNRWHAVFEEEAKTLIAAAQKSPPVPHPPRSVAKAEQKLPPQGPSAVLPALLAPYEKEGPTVTPPVSMRPCSPSIVR